MISYSGNIPELVKKEKYLQNTPVYIDHTDFNAIYSDTLGIGALFFCGNQLYRKRKWLPQNLE